MYQNEQIFELFNYDNWTNNISFTQNYWYNYIISNISYSLTDNNSYYSYYNDFYNFCIFNYKDILNFKLLDGTPVIDYFKDVNNINELYNNIFDFSTMSDVYSPLNIYNSIIGSRTYINYSNQIIFFMIFWFY